MVWNRNTGCPMHCFSLVVCRHPITLKWLAVEETKNRGWWLPGGFCECGDDHPKTAIKETIEEAGIDVSLKGILRIENGMSIQGGRQRLIYYAEPTNPNQECKSTPDKESNGAAWLTIQELSAKKHLKPKDGGLRGTELLDWADYIENGGQIYPLSVFATEHTPVPSSNTTITTTANFSEEHHNQQETNSNNSDSKGKHDTTTTSSISIVTDHNDKVWLESLQMANDVLDD